MGQPADPRCTSKPGTEYRITTPDPARELPDYPPLGFKSNYNYMIFPMKQSNTLPIHDDALHRFLGIRDPDELGGWTPEHFADYARCLQRRLKSELSETEMRSCSAGAASSTSASSATRRLANDEIIVPSISLYMSRCRARMRCSRISN